MGAPSRDFRPIRIRSRTYSRLIKRNLPGIAPRKIQIQISGNRSRNANRRRKRVCPPRGMAIPICRISGPSGEVLGIIPEDIGKYVCASAGATSAAVARAVRAMAPSRNPDRMQRRRERGSLFMMGLGLFPAPCATILYPQNGVLCTLSPAHCTLDSGRMA